MKQFIFRRPELAQELCNRLQGVGLADARSGLFLAAPRRVGKSTFLREDLLPEVTRRNWFPVYVDLWEKKNRDPGLLIADAIKLKLLESEGRVAKAARSIKLSKVSVLGSLTLDLAQPGLPPDVTIADVLAELLRLAKKPIVLIVDEAQHALSSEAGVDAMFALKAARDRLNTSADMPQLMLVFTGSNRDKLAHLVLNRSQPFFGSSVTPFPFLDRRFTDAFTAWANGALAPGNQFEPNAVNAAFQLVGHRPEMLRELVAQVALSGEAGNLSAVLEQGARDINNRLWDEFESEFESLTPIQKAVLQVLIEKGAPWSPFSEDSMETYRTLTGLPSISTATVQTALDGLRERSLVWKESRGSYALEDQGLAEWFKHRRLPETTPKEAPKKKAKVRGKPG